jgi:hypothetical protein
MHATRIYSYQLSIMRSKAATSRKKVHVLIVLPTAMSEALEAARASIPEMRPGWVQMTAVLPTRLDRGIEAIARERRLKKREVIAEAVRRYLKEHPRGRGERRRGAIIQHALETYVEAHAAEVATA